MRDELLLPVHLGYTVTLSNDSYILGLGGYIPRYGLPGILINYGGFPLGKPLSQYSQFVFDDAFAIALREDYVQRLARGQSVQQVPGSLPPVVPGQTSADAMDVSLLNLSQVDLATVDLAAIDVNALQIKCFTCSKVGHFQRDCPRNRGSRTVTRLRRSEG
jgi:hypothetical protein